MYCESPDAWKALEETTARMAAKRATASQLLALQSLLERQREACAVDDHDAFHEADELFHASIADSVVSGNGNHGIVVVDPPTRLPARW